MSTKAKATAALFAAVHEGCLEAITDALKAGADVNAEEEGSTPLSLAQQFESTTRIKAKVIPETGRYRRWPAAGRRRHAV
jgi:hypothetical protein